MSATRVQVTVTRDGTLVINGGVLHDRARRERSRSRSFFAGAEECYP
jgi:hypothetical protein